MKEFDWDYAMSLTKNKEKKEWLKSVHNKPITEEEFVAKWSSQPRYGRKPGKKYAPSASRKTYYQLKEKFGFFHV